MALFIRQTSERSKLQERLAAELREKAKTQSQVNTTRPDGVEDSQYLKDTKPTTSLAWVWIVIVILAIVAMVFVIGAARQ
jgi:type VI protein secretion system component VasF